jgi:hypothetical protein
MSHYNIPEGIYEYFLKHYPQQGNRHRYCAAIAGAFFKKGVPVIEIEQFISDLSIAANDDESTERVNNVEAACLSIKSNQPMVGIPTLKEIIGDEGSKELSKFFKLKPDNSDAPPKKEEKESNAEKMDRIVSKIELWHCESRKGYATLEIGGSKRHYAIKGNDFKEFLALRFFEETGKSPNSGLINDTINVILGRAKFQGQQYKTWLRVGWRDDSIYVDICDKDYNYVKISKSGWELTKSCPLKFRRGNAKALPTPERGGNINILRPFLNLDSDEDWVLLVAALSYCYYPFGPFPIISFFGEQGTAKTAALKICSDIIDPGIAVTRGLAKKEDDLIVSANNNWLVTGDNISYIPKEMSDALCRLATGGGLTKRALYTDDEEVCLDVKRPVLLTGINSFSDRQDLLERSIAIHFQRVLKGQRKEESVLFREYEAAKPKIFGALLDIISVSLRERDNVKSDNLPRLADFGKWGEAIAPMLGLEAGEFLLIYKNMNDTLLKKAVESDLVSSVIIEWLQSSKGEFIGGTTELHIALTNYLTNKNRKDDLKSDLWPKTVGALGRAIKRISSGLRVVGVEITTSDKGENHTTLHRIKLATPPKTHEREF